MLHEEKIAQSWTQDLEIPFQESTQFLALHPSQNEITINQKSGQYVINNPELGSENYISENIKAELAIPEKNKVNLLGMHNYEVPVFVNGHGFMVRLEGEFKQKDIHTFGLKKALPLKERQVVGEIKNESIKLPNLNIHSENISVNNSDIQKNMYILEKLSVAGIEVVTDKEEFEKK